MPEGMLAIVRVEHQGGYYGDANARLIASSPELLHFAKQIFNAIDTGAITIETAQDETLANVLAQGRAAVQKATGAIMSTQSIHRTTCAKPTPCATVIFDHGLPSLTGLRISPVSRRSMVRHYGPDDIDRCSTNSICRVSPPHSLQIGGRLMSRVAASAPIQRKRH